MNAVQGNAALEEKIEWLQYHLHSSILLKHSVFKRRAAAENKKFDFDTKKLKDKIRLASEHFANSPRYQRYKL